MQERKIASVFLEIFMVTAILMTLTSIALPRAGQIFSNSSYEGSEPVGYMAGMEMNKHPSLTRYYMEFYGYASGIIAEGIEQSLPDCLRRGLLITLFSIDYVQQLLSGQVSFKVFTE